MSFRTYGGLIETCVGIAAITNISANLPSLPSCVGKPFSFVLLISLFPSLYRRQLNQLQRQLTDLLTSTSFQTRSASSSVDFQLRTWIENHSLRFHVKRLALWLTYRISNWFSIPNCVGRDATFKDSMYLQEPSKKYIKPWAAYSRVKLPQSPSSDGILSIKLLDSDLEELSWEYRATWVLDLQVT